VALHPSAAIRQFHAGDDDVVVRLWNETLIRDPISLALFRRQTLLNPNFRPEGCLVAEMAGEPVGFALVMAPRVGGLHAGAAGSGRIVGLGVLPQARRQGIGSALLDQAIAFLVASGCQWVTAAAHEYYAAGVDRDAYAEGIAFLTKRHFRPVNEAIAMGRELYDLVWPADVRVAEARLHAEGVDVRSFEPAYTYALVEYFRAEFPDWVEFFKRKLDAGHDLDEMVIATDGDRVVGYCQHLDADHVGPFGVAAAYRNRGIGSVMLYRLLDRMREKGYRFAWFGETGRARLYYERAGFHVTRVYTILRRDLSPDEAANA
jgi:ribosomal protein S18 acetylase RimI-like enzyme